MSDVDAGEELSGPMTIGVEVTIAGRSRYGRCESMLHPGPFSATARWYQACSVVW